MYTDLKITTRPTDPIVSVEEIKEHGHVDSAYDDSNFTAYLMEASLIVEKESGRYFRSQVWTQYNTCFESCLALKLVGFDSVVVKYYDTNNTLQTVNSTNYFVGNQKIVFNNNYSFPNIANRVDAVQILFTFGNEYLLPIAKDATRLKALDRYKNKEATVSVGNTQIELGYQHAIDRLRVRVI